MRNRARRALQRQVPRHPHKPNSQRMGARYFMWYDGWHYGVQFSKRTQHTWLDGEAWPKYVERQEAKGR